MTAGASILRHPPPRPPCRGDSACRRRWCLLQLAEPATGPFPGVYAEIAADYIRAQGDPALMMDFSNGRLAEPFRQQISKLKPGLFRDKAVHIAQLVADGQSPPTGVIPRWAGLLLLTVDTQKDSFWYVLRALGHACRSKLIRYGEVRTFDELVALADARFPIEGLDNTYLHAARAFIDSGGTQDMDADRSRTDQVYRFCLSDPRFIPTKGHGRLDAKPYHFSNIKRGDFTVELCLVNVSHYKDVLTHRVHIAAGEPGEWMVHESIDDDYARQMASEHKVLERTGPRKGRQVWKPLSEGRANHLWDCEVLQMLGADMMNADLIPPAEELTRIRTRATRPRSRPAMSPWLPEIAPEW